MKAMEPVMDLTPAQVRAARGLLDWSQARLAKASNISLGAVRGFESGQRSPSTLNLAAIQHALERGGVIFQGDRQVVDGGPGVRLERPKAIFIGSPVDVLEGLWVAQEFTYRSKSYRGVAFYDALASLSDAEMSYTEIFTGNRDMIAVIFRQKVEAGDIEDGRVSFCLGDWTP